MTESSAAASTTAASPARTPLHDWHASHGGRMVDFAGWAMPVQYTSIVAEHQAARQATGLFDISHMGRLRFTGAAAGEFIENHTTRRADTMQSGQVRYSLLTDEAGRVLDDILIYRLKNSDGSDDWMWVVNASNRPKVLDFIQPRLANAGDVQVVDLTSTLAMIAVQGPGALELVQPLVDVPLAAMKYYTGRKCLLAGQEAIVTRTGYTGEDGCELIVPSELAVGLWQQLIDAGAVACGLGCRDTLRLEAAMPLYGHELSEQITPWEVGLEFAVNLEGRAFPGSKILADQRSATTRRRVGIVLDGKRVAREGNAVALASGEVMGETTSGTFSPTLQKSIAMALVDERAAEIGARVMVDIRGKLESGEVVALPFYRRAK